MIERLTRLAEEGSDDALQLELQAEIDVLMDSLDPIVEAINEVVQTMEPEIERAAEIEAILEPEIEEIMAIQERYADHIEAVSDIQEDLDLEGINELHEALAPLHREIELRQKELESFQSEMDRLHDKLSPQLEAEVERRLRIHLAVLVPGNAAFSAAARDIVKDASIEIDDDGLRFSRRRSAVDRILRTSILAGVDPSTADIDAAVERTLDAVASFRLTG